MQTENVKTTLNVRQRTPNTIILQELGIIISIRLYEVTNGMGLPASPEPWSALVMA
jgi:hypothetical protein